MNKPVVRKRRTREHIIADLSVNHVERQVLLCGHTAERIFHDYGYDLLLTTYDRNGEPENGTVHLQIKATNALLVHRNGQSISWSLSRTDLARWLYDPVPVILLVYDARKEAAYWLYIQRYFLALPSFNLFAAGQTVTVHIPVAHVLNAAAVGQFAQFRDAVSRQMKGVIDHNA